jgi:uncharacterized protein involved in outer membrane biogenesis
MKKVLKRIGITLGSLIILVILALIIVPLFIDIQKFKPAIEQQVTKATGRAFTIGGDLKLSLFPLAGIAFSDVHLGNPDGFTEKDFISVKSLDMKVKLMPLLSKDIQVRRFVLVGPRIVLEKTKDGKASWQGLGKKDSAVIPEEEKAQKDSVLPIKGLTVAEFSVSEGELLYIDHASGTRKEVKGLRIEVKDVSLEKPLKLSVSAIADGKPVSIEGEAGPIGSEPGKGTMAVNLAVKAMDMLSMTIEGSATDIASKPQFDIDISVDNFSPKDLIKGLKPDFNLKTKDPEVLKTMSARMKLKGATDNIDISDGTIELDQSRMTFSAASKDFAKPDLVLKINLDKIDMDRYLPPVEEQKAVSAQAPASPQKQEKMDYSLLRKLLLDSAISIGELIIKGAQVKDIQVKVKGRDGIFNIDRVSLNAYEGSISSTAVMNVSGDIPVMQADIDIKGLQFRKLINGLLPDLTLNTKDPEALKSLSAKVKMKGTTENISVSEGTIKLDQSRMTFSATAKDFSKPDLTFKMDLDRIDADRYLPPPAENKTEEKTQTPQKINYEPLRKMILDSVINVGELTIKGIQIKDIRASVKGQKGVFNLNPLSLNAYEGNVSTVAGLDFSGDVPASKAKIDARGVQVRKLVSDLMKKDIIEGAATGNISLSMSGDTAALIKKTLNGKGEVSLKDGAIVGIDLPGMINNLKTAFGTAQAAETTERTDFSEFIIPFDIKNGVITTLNTSLVSPALRIKAKGNADLTKDTLDFRIEPTFVKTLKGQGDTKERSGYTVPVLVKGTFADPKFSPDLSGLLEKSLEKGIDKLLKDKTGDDEKSGSTKDAVKGLLKGLLGK